MYQALHFNVSVVIKICKFYLTKVTKRPIVNHPHYEDTGLRDRTHKLYTMFSRRPVEMVHKTMVDMELDYFILEDSWCTRGRVSVVFVKLIILHQNLPKFWF